VGGAVAAPTAGVGVLGLYRRWCRIRLEGLEVLLAAGHHAAVARGAGLLARASPYRAEAVLLRTDALIQLGRPDEAAAALRALPRRVRAGPLGAYALARVLAAQGRPRLAAEALAQAVAGGGEFASRALADPAFDEAWRQPAARSLREVRA